MRRADKCGIQMFKLEQLKMSRLRLTPYDCKDQETSLATRVKSFRMMVKTVLLVWARTSNKDIPQKKGSQRGKTLKSTLSSK